MFAIVGEEYEILAPNKDLAYRIIHPLARIYARHSKVVTEISPDYIDISAAIDAVGDYAVTVFNGIREIRWMKRNGYVYQRPTGSPRQNSGNFASEPEPDIRDQRNSVEDTGEPEPNGPAERYAFNGAGRSGRGYRVNPEYAAQNGISDQPAGSTDIRGLTTIYQQDSTYDDGGRSASPKPVRDLTAEQQYQYDALHVLTQRDLNHRRRRAGLI